MTRLMVWPASSFEVTGSDDVQVYLKFLGTAPVLLVSNRKQLAKPYHVIHHPLFRWKALWSELDIRSPTSLLRPNGHKEANKFCKKLSYVGTEKFCWTKQQGESGVGLENSSALCIFFLGPCLEMVTAEKATLIAQSPISCQASWQEQVEQVNRFLLSTGVPLYYANLP